MAEENQYRPLLKFIVVSSISFFIGSIHGVLQVIRPVRAWLDSIGSPYGGPGHMIDPLAHAHINLIGGVTLLVMAASYYLLAKILDRPLYSSRLTELSFWLTTLGVYGFYITLLIFGTIEGNMLLNHIPDIDKLHHTYAAPLIASTSTVMGIGFWIYLYNVLKTIRQGSR